MADRPAFSKDLLTDTVEAAADLSSYQYRFMKWSSGQATYVSSQGAASIGILQNNPSAAGRAAVIAYGGISELELGGSVSQGDNLTSDTVGRGITATDPDEITICEALSDGSSGERIPVRFTWTGIASTLGVAGMSLANTKIWIGDASGEAAAFALSGDATMTAGGVVTVDNVTVGSDAQGDLQYKNATPANARLGIGTAGQFLQVNSGATAPQWSSMSGDAAIAVGGAVTINKKHIRGATFTFDSAAVIASNTTPLVLLDFSALQSAGTIAAGDVLIFHDCILQMNGGSAAYDQNQNFIAKYQTAGGGATVSTTLANFCNGAADGAMSTLKQLTTDITPEADQDIVLTSSASPKNAAGDRGLAGIIYYSVYTPV